MTQCKVVEDLLPLYEENLLQSETKAWVEDHLANCPNCRKLSDIEIASVISSTSTKTADKMITHAQLKLSIYQLLFVALSFIVAMSTTLFSNKGFHFILTYFLLGAISYYFYQSKLLTFLLAFIPVMLWTIIDTIYSWGSLEAWLNQITLNNGSILNEIIHIIIASLMMALIHTVFALVGILFVKCLFIAFKERKEAS